MGRSRNTTSVAPPPVAALSAGLAAHWPDARCELDHRNGYELLCATILAAQSTDRLINTVTPVLFARYPDPAALAQADPLELEHLIHATGFFRMKAKHLMGMARAVVERHGGQVPSTMAELVALPGVARKTANVVLSTVFGQNEGVVVDTHVTRLAQRLGLSRHDEPVKIEQDLMAIVPRDEWRTFADRLIWHGRRICFARTPMCGMCGLAPYCPSADIPGREGVAKPVVKPKGKARAAWTKAQRAKSAARAKPAAKAKTKPAARAKPAVKAKAKAKAKAKPKARR